MLTDTIDILVIGNGFDLALGLPTKYNDFLEFCFDAINYTNDSNYKFNSSTAKTLTRANMINKSSPVFECTPDCLVYLNEIKQIASDNFWIAYFEKLRSDNYIGNNWVDFETEISFIINYFEHKNYSLNEKFSYFHNEFELSLSGNLSVDEEKLSIFNELIINRNKDEKTFDDIIGYLKTQLEMLILAFDRYLFEFVEKIPVSNNNFFEKINPNFIISFNYTHSYNSVFKDIIDSNVFHVHGECRDNYLCHSNIVLGVSYCNSKTNTSNSNYNTFKKYLQRIVNKTDSTLLDFESELNQMCEHDNMNNTIRKKNIYFYGHSLDITDADLLKRLFKIHKEKIYIFSLNKKDNQKHYSNIEKILSTDTLIEKSEKKEIEFIVLNP